MIDVRAIANKVLDRADEHGVGVTNMALNKIVYFVHCDSMLETSEPLVSAKIEAWQHGPVFREIYHEFKSWGDRPICARAKKISPLTGDVEVASVTFGTDEAKRIQTLIDRYLKFSAAQLRALSHVEGGPWYSIWQHSGRANPGMEISNETIRDKYKPRVFQ